MGFFSYKCSKSKVSIPAATGDGVFYESDSEVVMVLPNNVAVRGLYDGYGRIITEKGELDIFELLCPFVGCKTRDEFFRVRKVFSDSLGVLFETEKFNYGEALAAQDILEWREGAAKLVIGKSMNELQDTYNLFTDSGYDRAKDMIRIVHAKFYEDDDYHELKPSKDCPYQGYFYSDSAIKRIHSVLHN